MKPRDLVLTAFLCALLFASKNVLDSLPNIELVSLLCILYTLEFPRKSGLAVLSYYLLYGAFTGFGLWWISQIHVWALLLLVTYFLKSMTSPLGWAIVNAIFGFLFGALCAIPYAWMNGISAAIVWWVNGIPFDLIHGFGNFIVALVLFSPLRFALQRAKHYFHISSI